MFPFLCCAFLFCCSQLIDRDCALVPRGAMALDSAKKVVPNANFAGLSFETSTQARAYMHMRQPLRLKGIALLKRPGILKTDDFLDCIDEDSPKGKSESLYFSIFQYSFAVKVPLIYHDTVSKSRVCNITEHHTLLSSREA